jgi:hypothetical protein
MKIRADKELLKESRAIVAGLTPEQCKWFLLERAFANNYPDVNESNLHKVIAAEGQQLLHDQLIGDFG